MSILKSGTAALLVLALCALAGCKSNAPPPPAAAPKPDAGPKPAASTAPPPGASASDAGAPPAEAALEPGDDTGDEPGPPGEEDVPEADEEAMTATDWAKATLVKEEEVEPFTDGLKRSCAFDPGGPRARKRTPGEEYVNLPLEDAKGAVYHEEFDCNAQEDFDQSCTYDACATPRDACQDSCNTTCVGCKERCASRCVTCGAQCGGGDCSAACGEETAACEMKCLAERHECRSETCQDAYRTCSKQAAAEWARDCEKPCARNTACAQACEGRPNKDACLKKCPSVPAKCQEECASRNQ